MADDFIVVTWTAGDIITEAKLDDMVANDTGFNDGTAIGDSAIINRHIGTNAVSGAQLGKMIGCILRRQAVQSINNTTDTKISWDNEDYDPDGLHTSGDVTIPTNGIYAVLHGFVFAGSSGGTYRQSKLYVNGSLYQNHTVSVTVDHPYGTIVDLLSLSATNTISIYVKHNYGSALNLYNAWLGVLRVGATSSS